MARPRIAILGRIAASTSATRFEAVVTNLRLAQAVWEAGGDPVTLLPIAGANLSERLAGTGGVLMPGGGDVNPNRYGQEVASERVYGVSDLQDQTDVEIFEHAVANGIPLLAICRGLQVINVARGGTLVQDMAAPHRNRLEQQRVEEFEILGMDSPDVLGSCFHHQCIDQLGDGLEILARAEAGHVEAIRVDAPAWTVGVQWHPEDNFETERQNLRIFERLVAEASKSLA